MGYLSKASNKEIVMGKIFEDITKTIGRTPLVRLNHVTEGMHAQVLVENHYILLQ